MNLEIKTEEKQGMHELMVECQVLENLHKDKATILKLKVRDILIRNGISPERFNLKFNAVKDEWTAELKDEVLSLPNREARRAVKAVNKN